MADIQLLLEAERRGLLPPDKIALLNEARSRGLLGDSKPVMQAQPEAAPQEPTFAEQAVMKAVNLPGELRRTAGNIVAGGLRGAGSIGATGMRILPNFMGGDTAAENEQRRAAIDYGLREMGADPESLAYQGGKLGTEIAGTAGVGGMIGKGVGLVSQSPKALALAEALRTGGMSAGGAGMGTRIAGGALSGGAMAGAINPEDVVTGAALGGALPPVVKGAGMVGSAAKNFITPKNRAVKKLIEDAGGIEQAKEAINRAVAAGKTLSGESYTLGQAGKNAGIAATERSRYATNPENFQRIYQAQRNARIAALQKIAGGSDDLARADALEALKSARAESTEGLYAGMQDVPFALGREGENLMARARPYGALGHAEKLAATQGREFSIPVVEDTGIAQSMDDITRLNASRQTYPDAVVGGAPADMPIMQPKDLLGEIRRLGGVAMRDAKDLLGERQITKMGVQGGVFTTKGEEVGDMVRRLVDRGVMPPQVLNDVDGGAQALRDAIQKAASGGGEDMAMRTAAESYYGAPEVLPGAFKEGVSAAPQQIPREIVDRVVKGGDLQAVKQGIDQVISNAEGPQKRALMQLKTDYLKFMETKSPEYIRANSIFSDMSKPITEMSVAQRMVDTLTGEAYKHGGEAPLATQKFLQAYRNAPLTARSVSGMRQPVEKIFTPENLKTVKRIAREVARHGDLERMGRGVGSDTAQKLARREIASSLADLVNSSRIGRAAVNVGTLGVKNATGRQLDQLLQNPEFAQAMLSDVVTPRTGLLSDLLANPATRAGLLSLQSR